MGLPVDEAIDDLDARAFERRGPEQILLLVEARLQFDHCGDRLARFGSGDQRVDDRGLFARAVQRLLDRDDVGVGGGLFEEGEHHVERLVRVMDDDVLRLDRGEAIAAIFADPLGEARREGREFEIGAILVDDRVEIADAEERAALGDEAIRPAQLVAQHRAEPLGHPAFELEPDDAAAPTPLDRVGKVADEILGLFLDLEIAVTQHAELRAADHAVAREDQRGEALHQRFDRDVARLLARQPQEARHRRGDHDEFADRLIIGDPDQIEHHRQPLVGDERERMRRVERLRRQDREELLAELSLEPGEIFARQRLVDRPRAEHRDARFGELAAQVAPHVALARHQRIGLGDDRRELLTRGQPVVRQPGDVLQLLALEAGHADHEEFVEVRSRDRQEADALEQRMRGVARFLEHAAVEREPGELAVEIAVAPLASGERVVVMVQAREVGGSGHRVSVGSGNKSGAAPGISPASINVARASGIDRRLWRASSAWSSRSTVRSKVMWVRSTRRTSH